MWHLCIIGDSEFIIVFKLTPFSYQETGAIYRSDFKIPGSIRTKNEKQKEVKDSVKSNGRKISYLFTLTSDIISSSQH